MPDRHPRTARSAGRIVTLLAALSAGSALAQDLGISSGMPTMSHDPVPPGSTVRLGEWTIWNPSPQPAGPFLSGYYLSTDSTISSSDTYLAGSSHSGLVGWGTIRMSTMGTSLTIPAGTEPGDYYIGILVDRTNAVREVSEINNYVSTPLAVGNIDLVIPSGNPTVSPVEVHPGDSVQLSAITIRNQGVLSAGLFATLYYLSTDPLPSNNDAHLYSNRNSALSFGASITLPGRTLTIPAETAPGNYYVGVLVDQHNMVRESDESNNYRFSNQLAVTPQLARDLLISSGRPTATPAYADPGSNVQISAWTVRNQGLETSGSFSSGFYLSTDAVITKADTYLGGNSNNSLAAGASFNWGGPTLTIPAGTVPGNYYIGILVDRTNIVAEGNEGNNYVSVPLTITPFEKPDLAITSGTPTVTPTSIQAPASVGVSGARVTNRGKAAAGNFRVSYYLSSDAVFSGQEDNVLDRRSISGLAPGQSYSLEAASVHIDPLKVWSTNYILIVVDDNNGIIESNESNNTVSVPLTVVSSGQ